MSYLSASVVVIHYEEVLYQMYAPFYYYYYYYHYYRSLFGMTHASFHAPMLRPAS